MLRHPQWPAIESLEHSLVLSSSELLWNSPTYSTPVVCTYRPGCGLYRVPAVSSPAAELQRGVVRFGRWNKAMYVIVWDTEHGHGIYLQSLDYQSSDHKDRLAGYAAEVIESRWWADAVVMMPLEQQLSSHLSHRDQEAYIYQLATTGNIFSGFRRWVCVVSDSTHVRLIPSASA